MKYEHGSATAMQMRAAQWAGGSGLQGACGVCPNALLLTCVWPSIAIERPKRPEGRAGPIQALCSNALGGGLQLSLQHALAPLRKRTLWLNSIVCPSEGGAPSPSPASSPGPFSVAFTEEALPCTRMTPTRGKGRDGQPLATVETAAARLPCERLQEISTWIAPHLDCRCSAPYRTHLLPYVC